MSYPEETRTRATPIYRLPHRKYFDKLAIDATVWHGKKDPTAEVITFKIVNPDSNETITSLALLRKANGEYWLIPEQQKLGLTRPHDGQGRICFGKIEPRYVDVAVKRWENFTGQKATKLEAGTG